MDRDFFEKHSDRFLEMAFSSARSERVLNPDGYGKSSRDCGDTVEIFLSLSGEQLEFVSYQVDGCMYTNACAAALSHLVEGKSPEEASGIKPEALISFLESLPKEENHCAEHVVGAFQEALQDMEKKN